MSGVEYIYYRIEENIYLAAASVMRQQLIDGVGCEVEAWGKAERAWIPYEDTWEFWNTARPIGEERATELIQIQPRL